MLSELPLKNTFIKKAFVFAHKAHDGQKRLSGESFINHPVYVAKLIHSWVGLNPSLIAAALLHDVIEDTSIKTNEIISVFGEDVASLVDGVSKLKSSKRNPDTLNNIKKVIRIGYLDPRVFVLKLADRLHNLKTLDAMSRNKQIEKAKETENVYSKLAESLGMWEVKKQLEDYAFRYTNPRAYFKTKSDIESDPRVKHFSKRLIKEISAAIPEDIYFDVYPSVNGVRAVDTKMMKNLERGISYDKEIFFVNDVVSIRVVTDTIDNCYRILGAIESQFREIIDEDRFDNYLLRPRSNGYSALQTTIDTKYGAVEIAITTTDREDFNRHGILSLLKDGGKDELCEYTMKVVFAENGNIYYLPKDARIVDLIFLYPQIFGHTKNIYVNGKQVGMFQNIPNGALIKVRFSQKPVEIDYEKALKYCLPATSALVKKAHSSSIRKSLRTEGLKKLQSILKEQGVMDLKDIPYATENLLYKTATETTDRLHLYIGLGLIPTQKIRQTLKEMGIKKDEMKFTTILLTGKNRSGIMAAVSKLITKLGGDIRSTSQHINSKSIFEIRILIQGLDNKSETILHHNLEKTGLFQKIVLV